MLRRIMLFAGLVALIAPAGASAAKPVVNTGATVAITPTTATLNGSVDANRRKTIYYFDVGLTSAYGANTVATPAGARANPIAVTAALTELAPATRYHYRLVAINRDGTSRGARRTFKTKPQPLGVSLGAAPNPVTPPGEPTMLSGQLTGTNNAGRQVVLQSNPFPYSQGFATLGNAQVTDGSGNFSFPVLSLPVSTQFRVLMPQRPEVVSPIVVVGAAVKVRAYYRKVTRRRHSVSVRFGGAVLPPRDGVRVLIQKYGVRVGQWITMSDTVARHATSTKSRYRTRVRIYRTGQYRVVAESQGDYVSGVSRTLKITAPR